ncbi:D-tyrosyl-tRNA(Tyr) deacylase [Candidatus Roizmanbacteria bacterium]|nr:D-tyrosyl-tRNA(Tyr) deacylase [Candidatus Roizmanbacteria bacterium]
MIALIQRVTKGSVFINSQQFSAINKGYVVLLGIYKDDAENDVAKLVEKISTIRIMSDEQGKMNKSILDTKAEILLISQFTLCADVTGGRRPSFINAKEPKEAERLYNLFSKKLKEKNIPVKTGKFAAYMQVQIFNDGPVTIILDSKNL